MTAYEAPRSGKVAMSSTSMTLRADRLRPPLPPRLPTSYTTWLASTVLLLAVLLIVPLLLLGQLTARLTESEQ